MTISEFFQSMIESSKDRLKNPILGAFIFAWLTVNWRFIAVLLFSDKAIEDKIDFIECNYFDQKINIWIPLIIAIFYVVILPYIMTLFDWLGRTAISTRQLINKNHRIADLHNRQEIAAEEWQLEKIRQGSSDITALKDKTTELELVIKDQNELIRSLTDKVPVSGNEIQHENSLTEYKPRQENQLVKQSLERTSSENSSSDSSSLAGLPTMKEIVIRDLPKTEREWILVYSLYASDLGKNVITRENLLSHYNESNRRTESRISNLSNNMKTMIKSGQLKPINDDEMLLTPAGIEMAKEILNR